MMEDKGNEDDKGDELALSTVELGRGGWKVGGRLTPIAPKLDHLH